MSDPRDFGPKSRYDDDSSRYLAWLAAAAAGLVIIVAITWGSGERPRTASKPAPETTGQSTRQPTAPSPGTAPQGAPVQGAPATNK